MPNAKVGKHGEIVIKKRLRNKYGINPGQDIIQLDAGDHIALIPVSNDPIISLDGKYTWEIPINILKKRIEELTIEDILIR